MKTNAAIGWFVRLIWATILFGALLMPNGADAHRPGESYVYLIIKEAPLEGEYHVRFSDMAKVVSLDVDDDGVVTDEEVIQSYGDIADYLTSRLRFIDGSSAHEPVPGELELFGPSSARQFVLKFSVPTIDPPPEALAVDYRFLYDGIDTEHVPMLLLKKNVRTGLRYNEAGVSLVFGTGTERQVVSFMAPPVFELVAKTLPIGFMQIILNSSFVIIALAALLGCLRWRAQREEDEGGVAGLARNAAMVALMLACGYIAGVFLKDYYEIRLPDRDTKNVLAAALGLAFLGNLLVMNGLLRGVATIGAGVLCGATSRGYLIPSGQFQGITEVVLPSYALGLFLAYCLLAAALLPAGAVLFQRGRRSDRAIHLASLVLVIVALLFVVNRVFIQSN